MSIKIIEDLKPWEVMKRASEGESVAYKSRRLPHSGFTRKDTLPLWNWDETIYAIIDTSAPEIDWSQFNYEFFNQYGGVSVTPVNLLQNKKIQHADFDPGKYVYELRESPFYYWPGGECPVPGNVEVEVIMRSSNKITRRAGTFTSANWRPVTVCSNDIIAFRLTGNVL